MCAPPRTGAVLVPTTTAAPADISIIPSPRFDPEIQYSKIESSSIELFAPRSMELQWMLSRVCKSNTKSTLSNLEEDTKNNKIDDFATFHCIYCNYHVGPMSYVDSLRHSS